MIGILPDLSGMRSYYESGETLPYEFRKKQLLAFRNAIKKYEHAISEALYTDLRKSPEEAYATETGLLLGEISRTLKNLHKWMKPKKVSTDLLNFPSDSTIYHEPLGVVLIIAPWNYPLQLLLIPLVGSIAGGNCAVIKPSELAPATSALIRRIISEIFSGNYIKVVEGEGAQIIPDMVNDFRFDHIFYTGSTHVGKIIYQLAAKNLIPVTLELGGKSPCIVEPDANIKVAARRISLGKFANAGQTCIAPDYVLVHNKVKNDLVKELKSTLQKFYSDDASISYDYGKIINENRFDKLLGYLKEGKILHGGKHDRESLFIEPSIVDEVKPEDKIMQEEIFGPILPILSYNSTDEAMQIVKKNYQPLALYLFTTNKKTENEWMKKISFGGGCINNTLWHFANSNLPFGGIGNSGTGAYHGKFSFNTFTHAKPVLKTPSWPDPSLRYPPMKGKLKWFKKLVR